MWLRNLVNPLPVLREGRWFLKGGFSFSIFAKTYIFRCIFAFVFLTKNAAARCWKSEVKYKMHYIKCVFSLCHFFFHFECNCLVSGSLFQTQHAVGMTFFQAWCGVFLPPLFFFCIKKNACMYVLWFFLMPFYGIFLHYKSSDGSHDLRWEKRTQILTCFFQPKNTMQNLSVKVAEIFQRT